MRSLYGVGSSVPFSRVLREHQRALVPLVFLLIVNIVVLVAAVLPLSQRVATNQVRADVAARDEAIAAAEFKQAEAMQSGKARAATDLGVFYTEVLPVDFSTARRLTQSSFQQKARQHDVLFERSATTEDQERGSSLRRLTLTMTLSGTYDDIRAFIHDLETSPDFVVIDNVVLTQGDDANEPLAVALEVSTYFREPGANAQVRTDGR